MIILISGKMGSGKTTSANYLARRLGGEVGSFAAKVKDIAHEIGWDGVKDEKGRKLLQDIGRAGRDYDPDCWAEILFSDHDLGDILVVDDWRFPNEYSVAKRHDKDVITLRIKRKDTLKYASEELNNDSSETSLTDNDFPYDFVIDNNGTMNDLYESLDKFLKKISKFTLGEFVYSANDIFDNITLPSGFFMFINPYDDEDSVNKLVIVNTNLERSGAILLHDKYTVVEFLNTLKDIEEFIKILGDESVDPIVYYSRKE